MRGWPEGRGLLAHWFVASLVSALIFIGLSMFWEFATRWGEAFTEHLQLWEGLSSGFPTLFFLLLGVAFGFGLLYRIRIATVISSVLIGLTAIAISVAFFYFR